MTFTELKPTHPLIERSGRWSRSPLDTLTASWCSASLCFHFSGQSLRIRAGRRTGRKDPWNGGTPMLVWTITPVGTEDSDSPLVFESADVQALEEIILVDKSHVPLVARCLCCVQITLVDWASVFEVEAILVESEEYIRPFPSSPATKVLLIGDSISCGYTLSSQKACNPTCGYYNAFPAIAQRVLRDQGNAVQIETIAYPGITLVNPTESEGMASGMVDRFFHCSPWDTVPLADYGHPSMVIIALGTNDEACAISAERFVTTLQDFIGRLLQLFRTSVKYLFVIHPFADFTEPEGPSMLASGIPAILDCIRKESNHDGVTLDHFNIASTMSHDLTGDGLHPTTDGHKLLGWNLVGKLAPFFPI